MIPPNRIRETRERRGWTLEELAARVPGPRATHFSTIEKLENSKRRLSLEWLDRLGEALGVAAADLLDKATFDRMMGRQGVGGRRPQGQKAKGAALNFRTDPDTYARVKARADAAGRSLTQEVERLVRQGLDGGAA